MINRNVIRKLCLAIAIVISLAGCTIDFGGGPGGKDEEAPASPSGLTVVRAMDGEVELAWQPNTESDLAGYNIYRAEADDSDNLPPFKDYVVVGTATSPNFTDRGLSYAKYYYYRVSAYDTSGNESSPSAYKVVRLGTNTSPDIPQGLKAIARNYANIVRINLSWRANTESDLAGYEIYRSVGSIDNFEPSEIATTNSYIDPEVEVGTRYYYRIRAFDEAGLKSAYSDTVSDIPLLPPKLLEPSDGASVDPRPTFKWEAVDGAKGYVIWVTTSEVAGEIWVQMTTSTSITYPGSPLLLSGESYYWKVSTYTNDPWDINSISGVRRFTIR